MTENDFKGYYLDANAIAPKHAHSIGQLIEANGIHFIDREIIVGPKWEPNETWLYLAGRDAQILASCFSNGPPDTKIIGEETGKAPAFKICYASYTKETTALLGAVLATAESLGVRNVLYQRWKLDDVDLVKQTGGRTTRVTAKAWRFEDEIYKTLVKRQRNLPEGKSGRRLD